MKLWHGFRPTTANSYPVIGGLRICQMRMLGLGISILIALGPQNGPHLAETISNRPVNKDLSVFDPNQQGAAGLEVHEPIQQNIIQRPLFAILIQPCPAAGRAHRICP